MQEQKLLQDISSLVGEDVSHSQPDVLHLRGVVPELLPLPLPIVRPVPGPAVVAPRPFHVARRVVLHQLGALGTAKVPAGVGGEM